jgi:hypothetical protein
MLMKVVLYMRLCHGRLSLNNSPPEHFDLVYMISYRITLFRKRTEFNHNKYKLTKQTKW